MSAPWQACGHAAGPNSRGCHIENSLDNFGTEGFQRWLNFAPTRTRSGSAKQRPDLSRRARPAGWATSSATPASATASSTSSPSTAARWSSAMSRRSASAPLRAGATLPSVDFRKQQASALAPAGMSERRDLPHYDEIRFTRSASPSTTALCDRTTPFPASNEFTDQAGSSSGSVACLHASDEDAEMPVRRSRAAVGHLIETNGGADVDAICSIAARCSLVEVADVLLEAPAGVLSGAPCIYDRG